MVRTTLQIGNPLLKAKNVEILDFQSEKLAQVVTDLRDTMYENKLIGIAAPQIGENFQVFVTEPRQTNTRPASQSDEFRVFINPKIVLQSAEETQIFEGCGSVMNGTLFGPVIRPKEITIEAYNEHGKRFRFTADGILGRVIQHEYDHLLGIEFTEKITDYKKLLHLDFYLEYIKNSPEQILASEITKKDCAWL